MPSNLTLDKVNVIGKPRHGKLQGSTLTLDVNGGSYATEAYSGTGDTTYVKTGVSRINRTPEQAAADLAAGLEWRDDCVFYGHNRDYSVDARNKGLGADGVLYTDGNGNNWLLNFGSTIQGGGTADYTVKLKNLFGRFGGYNAPHRNKLLSTQAIPPVASASIYGFDPKHDIYQNPNGSKVLVHVRSSAPGNDNLLNVQEIWEVTISGNGTIPTQASEDGLLGDGITATWAQLKSYSDCYILTPATTPGAFATNTIDTTGTIDIPQGQHPVAPNCGGTVVGEATYHYYWDSPHTDQDPAMLEHILLACYNTAGEIQIYSLKDKFGLHSRYTDEDLTFNGTGTYTFDDTTSGFCTVLTSTYDYFGLAGVTTRESTKKDIVYDFEFFVNGALVAQSDYHGYSHSITDFSLHPDGYPDGTPVTENKSLVDGVEVFDADTHTYQARVFMLSNNTIGFSRERVLKVSNEVVNSEVIAISYGAVSSPIIYADSTDPATSKASFNPKTADIALALPTEDQPVYL